MKEILAELYNKVASFFISEKSENTKDIASNRLKLVLMHDRTKLDPLTLEKMRYELIDVISRYVVIDKELLELNLAGEGDSIALMLNIPVVRAKTEEELLIEAEKDAEEKEQEDDETIKEDLDDELDAALDSEDMSYEQEDEVEENNEETEETEETIAENDENEINSEIDIEVSNSEEQSDKENVEEPKKEKKQKK